MFYRIVHPDDRLDFDRHKDEMTQKIAPYEVEFRVIRPDGAVRWIGYACQPVFAPDGHFLGMRGSNRDITERKRAEEALRESEERFRTIFRESAMGIGLTDLEGWILNANPALLQMLRYRGEEFIGKSIFEFTHPDDVGKEKQSFQQLKEGNSDSLRFEKRYVRKDGAS